MEELLDRSALAFAHAETFAINPGGPRIFFGGPEQSGQLRDLLEAHIDEVPGGGEIFWTTYYFRDERLAEALVRAHRRGVRVRVAVEGAPRVRGANDAVIRRLGAPDAGIGGGLRVIHRGLFRHLHEKLYCFSHPQPMAYIGSFNPSGNGAEDSAILRKIGDQDRGHNYLVRSTGAEVEPLMAHAQRLHERRWPAFRHFARELARPAPGHGLAAYFFPRWRSPLDRLLRSLLPGTHLRVAASHLRDGSIAALLARLASAEVRVELLTEATERRVPPRIERRIRRRGIAFERYHHTDHLPMHCKFMLADGPAGRWAAFGSFNLTRTSRWLNHEILCVTRDEGLFDAFARRWNEIRAESVETRYG